MIKETNKLAQQITLLGFPFSPSSLPPPLPQTPFLRTPVPPQPLRQSGRRPLQSTAGAAPLCCTFFIPPDQRNLTIIGCVILILTLCIPFTIIRYNKNNQNHKRLLF